MLAPREKSRAAWKTAQGPAKSINSVPSDTTKATFILPWAGGTSLVAGAADGLGGCWANASPGKEMKTMKTMDSLFSLLYIDAVYIRAANPVLRRFRMGRRLAAAAAHAPARLKRLRVSPSSTVCFLCVMRFSSYLKNLRLMNR